MQNPTQLSRYQRQFWCIKTLNALSGAFSFSTLMMSYDVIILKKFFNQTTNKKVLVFSHGSIIFQNIYDLTFIYFLHLINININIIFKIFFLQNINIH